MKVVTTVFYLLRFKGTSLNGSLKKKKKKAKRKMKEVGVSFCSKEEAMMGKVETLLNDCCATLRLSVCECEMYILYTQI